MRNLASYLALPCFVLGLALTARAADAAADTRVFELRTYTSPAGKLDTLQARFRDNTLRIFARHGMENIGYWLPTDEKDGAGSKITYLIAHKSRDAAKASWASFSADPEWKEVAKASEANGKIVTKVESVYLAVADFSPAVAAAMGKGGEPRVFELRTYTTPEGKLDALDARFRDHTIELFKKHGMTNLFYFHPLDANKGAGHTLTYFLAHKSREAATASWAAFRADPVWVKAKADSEKNGPITTKVESVFLAPTDFSPIK
jgi:hypothetical protein